jgi:ribonuclease-3
VDIQQQQLSQCEDVLQYRFRDPELLATCLTHASVAKTRLGSNERLEFLGDAVLGTIVCELLYRRFPEFSEGELTRIKSVLVSRSMCAQYSTEMGLDRYLWLGKGLSGHGGVPPSIQAAVFESLVGGLYLDGGLEVARAFIERAVAAELERTAEREHSKNFKSLLQQLSQKTRGETPVYRLLDEKGPDHSKCFKISAAIGPQVFPAAWGPNKKEAEQRAAQNALYEIEGKEIPHAAD